MAMRFMCDDCGEIIEQFRVKETDGDSEPHDRCLSCALAHLAELAETTVTLEFVNPTLEGIQYDGKVC